jgi:hypothetical protein
MKRESSGSGAASGLWALVAVAALLIGATPARAHDNRQIEVRVLSNNADMLSGGDALVEVKLPAHTALSQLSVELRQGRSSADVSSAFALRANGSVQGLVSGIPVGKSTLTARLRHGGADSVQITMHPSGGPIFAGEQVQPWFCETEAQGLGPALDAQCNAPSRLAYFYRKVGATALSPYDPANPPGDVDSTLTDAGVQVPYIVRRELGTLDRGIYAIAVLAQPDEAFAPWQPPRAWNGKLFIPFGGGAAPSHFQGAPGNVLNDFALSRGFAVATTSLDTFGNNTNSVVSAEAVMMLKERIAESLGPIRYTMSNGVSGGAMQQHLITNAYPGLLDGIMPGLSFADLYKNNREVQDCTLLVRYFRETSPGLWPDVVQRNAVFDNANGVSPGTCEAWPTTGLDRNWADPRVGCDKGSTRTASWMYDPATNPTGERCTLQDYQVTMLGTRKSDGFANGVFDNVGVQYGLVALNKGTITPEQFVDMNERVGGRDIDWNWTAQRAVADVRGLFNLFRTGQINMGTGMDTVPIIDDRMCRNTEVHSCYHSWVMRARLIKTHGSADNHVILVQAPANTAFLMMDRWLAAIEADRSHLPLTRKVVLNKPFDVSDSCWIDGTRVFDEAKCRAAYPYYGNPHFGAGNTDMADDVLKCRLVPLYRSSYKVALTDAQWERLSKVFPHGVCDWTKPSIGFTRAQTWLDFDNRHGKHRGDASLDLEQ